MKSPTDSKVEQIPADGNSVSTDVINISALQGMTKNHSDGKFAKKSTTAAVTSKNIMNTDTIKNKTNLDFSFGNNLIDDWKWIELETDDNSKKKFDSVRKTGKRKNKVKGKNASLSYDFKVIDGFFIPKQTSNVKKGIKIESRVPNITVRKPSPSPTKTSIKKQSMSTIYHVNSTEETAEPGDILHGAGPAEYLPSTQVLSVCSYSQPLFSLL